MNVYIAERTTTARHDEFYAIVHFVSSYGRTDNIKTVVETLVYRGDRIIDRFEYTYKLRVYEALQAAQAYAERLDIVYSLK